MGILRRTRFDQRDGLGVVNDGKFRAEIQLRPIALVVV